MTLLYVVPLIFVLGVGAIWAFLWALQSGGMGQQRRRRLQTPPGRTVSRGPADIPGLDVPKGKARPAAQPAAARKRAGGGAAE